MSNSLGRKIKDFIKKNYIMSKEDKIILADRNLHRLRLIVPFLFIFGLSLFVATVILHIDNLHPYFFKLVYYGLFFTVSLITYVWTTFFLTLKKLNPFVKNMPLHFLFITLMFVCIFTFFSAEHFFNCCIIFACITTVTVIIFYIEPIVYTVIVTVTFLIIWKLLSMTPLPDEPTILNASFYVAVLIFLCLFRWRTSIIEMNELLAAKKRKTELENEIEIAGTVQENFFAQDLPSVDNWEIGFFSKAFAGVSGDLYDFYSDNGSLTGLGIFDVSGEGLSSGLITMLVKNIIQDEFSRNKDIPLDTLVEHLSRKVFTAKGELDNYLTGIILRFTSDNDVEFVSAGHPVPVIYKKESNSADFFLNSEEERYGVIGMGDYPAKYVTEKLHFSSGDEIVLYTDGITECVNRNGDTFGKDRLLKSVNDFSSLPVDEQVSNIVNDLQYFANTPDFNDDITFIILKKK